jgi:2-polyprenyl-3-methyl-5-hydroxy-6-metoxy-1,4-benzoquinol methylase
VSSPSRDVLRQGHYARKQIFSRNAAVAWSHRRRFALARELAGRHAGGALLDYGCGDGTFIALAHEAFAEAVGADIDDEQVRGCADRLGALHGVRFLPTDALRAAEHRSRYDVIVCMEVLEHCPADVQPAVLDDLSRLARPGARVIISVPIEIGATLVLKQAVRAVAAATGLAEYAHRERYSAREFLRMVFAGRVSQIPRPETRTIGPAGEIIRFHGHKGFNWRRLEPLIAHRFTIQQRLYSPVPLARQRLNSQVWFVCAPR